jgi:uncharacterized protein
MMVTALYAGLLALWYLVLSIRVIRMRGTAQINLGDGGNPAMLRRIRAHANFNEYVPLCLLLMALLEMGHTSIYELHLIGALLLLARVLHGIALAFTEKWLPGRFIGTLVTFFLMTLMGLQCIWMSIHMHMVWNGGG